jgi:hypothetical protein
VQLIQAARWGAHVFISMPGGDFQGDLQCPDDRLRATASRGMARLRDLAALQGRLTTKILEENGSIQAMPSFCRLVMRKVSLSAAQSAFELLVGCRRDPSLDIIDRKLCV